MAVPVPLRHALALSSLVLLLSSLLAAQNCDPGELRVSVVDVQGAPVFGATVHLRGTSLTTGAGGVAAFEQVVCGPVELTAEKAGFAPTTRTAEIKGGTNQVTLTLNLEVQTSSLDVTASAPAVQQNASQTTELHPSEVKTLPTNPATVSDALPLVPGVVRSQDGELKLDGSGEHRSALVVNQTDVTDPATGKFGQTVPIDAVETVNVLNTPFLAQYGRFTSGVVAVETRRGGEKWHAELNDPFPDFRVRSFHLRGIRNETPRAFVGGPLIKNRLYLNSALQYFFQRDSSRTLPFPYNESRQEFVNSFTQVDWIQSQKQIVTTTFHLAPQHQNFLNPDYFNPQPVTPSSRQQNYFGTVADHFGLFGGLLDSSLSFQQFNIDIGAQGSADMILTPQGARGNFFGAQNRAASRIEWLETWAPTPVHFRGNHLFKGGTSLTHTGDDGQFFYRPVNILDAVGRELQRIDFTNRSAFSRADLEFTGFVQDHWSVNSKLAFDFGARFERQRLPQSERIAPRAGVAWTPFSNETTVFRAGYGQFYDHLPLDIYTFSRYPNRIVTNYAPDGSIIGMPIQFVNVIGSVTGPRSFLVNGKRVAGAFAPRGLTWNLQAEHTFSRWLKVRAVYTDNRSVGLVVLDPDFIRITQEIVLNANGDSRYRRAELTARFTWKADQQMVLAYTRSRAEGSLNSFDTFLGNIPLPIIRPEVYSNLPGDLPNRFLLWGRARFGTFSVLPIIEYRNGFPYTQLDEHQNYVGVPNNDRSRYPDFFSADARIMRDFKVNPKYTVRLSLSTFNITNHFNPLLVHSNVADPQYGIFFGKYKRRYRGDFEVVF